MAPSIWEFGVLLGDATDIAALIADGADVNERNSDGDTPLIVACEHGLTEVVAVLLAEPRCKEL